MYEDEDDLYRFPCTTTPTPTPTPATVFPCGGGGLLTPPPSGSILKRSVPLPDEFPEHAYGGLLDSPLVRVRSHHHHQHSPPPTPPDDHDVIEHTPPLSLLDVGPTQADLLSPLSPEWMDTSMPPSDDEPGGSFLLGADIGVQSPTLSTLALPDDHDDYYYQPADVPDIGGPLLLIDVDVPQARSPSPEAFDSAPFEYPGGECPPDMLDDLRHLLELRHADERLVRTLERGGARKRAKERAREVEALVRLKVGGEAPPHRVKKGKTIVGSMKQLVARMVFRRREGDGTVGREGGVVGRRECVGCPSKLREVLDIEEEEQEEQEDDDDDELGLGLKMGDIWTTT